MPDEEIIVGSFPTSEREEVRVTFSRFKGHQLLGVRVWYRDGEPGLRVPHAGLTIRLDLLPKLVVLLGQATQMAAEKGWLGGDNNGEDVKEEGGAA
jgi:hypothetical protein